MANALISIIIPVYNTEPYLRQCLDSVCGQTYRNLEIICVDDESPDRSGEILEEYARRDSRVKVIHRKNGGLSAARNSGLAAATGEWVAMVDSDDYLETGALTKLLAVLRPESEAVFYEISPEGNVSEERKRSSKAYYALKFEGVQNVDSHHLQRTDVSMVNKLIKRSVIEKHHLRFPEGKIFEDACFFICLMGVLDHVYYLKEPLYHYCMRDGSIMSSAFKKTSRVLDHLRIMEDICEFYDRHGLRSSKGALLGYAFQYCCGFTEYHCPESLRDEVQQLECEMARKAGLLHYGMSHLPAVLKLRDMALPAWERLFHRCNNHQDKFGPLGFPLFSVVHEETEDVFRFLKFELKRKAVTRRPQE